MKKQQFIANFNISFWRLFFEAGYNLRIFGENYVFVKEHKNNLLIYIDRPNNSINTPLSLEKLLTELKQNVRSQSITLKMKNRFELIQDLIQQRRFLVTICHSGNQQITLIERISLKDSYQYPKSVKQYILTAFDIIVPPEQIVIPDNIGGNYFLYSRYSDKTQRLLIFAMLKVGTSILLPPDTLIVVENILQSYTIESTLQM